MMEFNEEMEKCLEVLANGGTLLYPTDTVWGMGCDATNAEAVQKLLKLKGKPEQKGLIVLLATERDVLHYVANPDLAVFDYLKTCSKPTTVIYDTGLGVADNVLNADGSIAIRLVQDEFCRHLVKRFRKPIVSTSANFHGDPSPTSFSTINPQLISAVDYASIHRRSDNMQSPPSSLIRWNRDATVTVVRN